MGENIFKLRLIKYKITDRGPPINPIQHSFLYYAKI